jgi:hypothetical protein
MVGVCNPGRGPESAALRKTNRPIIWQATMFLTQIRLLNCESEFLRTGESLRIYLATGIGAPALTSLTKPG